MQTPNVNASPSPLGSIAPANKAASQIKNAPGPTAVTPFNQVLAKEISQKNNAPVSASNSPKNTAPSATPAQRNPSNDSSQVQNNAGGESRANATTNTVSRASDGNPSATITNSATKTATANPAATDATGINVNDTSGNAQLLALVSSLGQLDLSVPATDGRSDIKDIDKTTDANIANPAPTLVDAASLSLLAQAAGVTGQSKLPTLPTAADLPTTSNTTSTAVTLAGGNAELDASTLASQTTLTINTATSSVTSDAAAVATKPEDKLTGDFSAALSAAKLSTSTTTDNANAAKPNATNDNRPKAIGDLNTSSNTNTNSTALASDKAATTIAADQKAHAITVLADLKAPALEKASDPSLTVQSFSQQLGMAGVATQQANNSSTVEHLTPSVGTPAWDQAVGQKVVWMVAGGQQTAELTLNPPDLGPLQIVLSLNNDQANATFIAAQPEVREALELAMPKLRQMMSDAGVQLSGFSVGSQASNQAGNPFAGQHAAANGGRSGPARNLGNDVDLTAGAVRSGVSIIKPKLGAVDTFA